MHPRWRLEAILFEWITKVTMDSYLFTRIHLVGTSKIHWTNVTCLVMNNYLHGEKGFSVFATGSEWGNVDHLICRVRNVTFAGREFSGTPRMLQ
jgi:hypothetical protein